MVRLVVGYIMVLNARSLSGELLVTKVTRQSALPLINPQQSLFLQTPSPPFTMRFSTPACLLAFAALVLANEEAAPSDVLNLTAASFEATVNAESLMLVEFFAPWYALVCSTRFAIINSSLQVRTLQGIGAPL